jgi:AcrR family transcriptional regulator
MSRNEVASAPKVDRRITRTRDALGDALIELMQEQPFDTITVQHVLDRANVGRSTFYTHFRDKDDLFLSDVEDFLEMMSTLLSRNGEASQRVVPVRELFEHGADMRRLSAALVAAGKMHDFLELSQGYFARSIEQRLATLPASQGIPAAQRAAMAHAFAGSLLSLMSWWIDRGSPGSAQSMDDLYHQMVWSGIRTMSAPD